MMPPLQEAVLFKSLKDLGSTNSRAPVFVGKLIELDDVATNVLALIRLTFPHYTEHGRQHYLTLIQRMGQFLPADLLTRLSAVEYFLLMSSAMLHDIGMVVAESELRVLDRRKDFTEFRARFLKELPKLPVDADPPIRAVLDRQVVAEYFRARHHKRSAQLVFSQFGQFIAPFGPPNSRLVKVLARICEGHGLAREELEDKNTFPLNVDIDGESANARFLAVTLRLADLLDMDSSRACPLILRLVSPLPSGSTEHWTRHHLDDLNVSPTEIRIGKICTDAGEQWTLYQWVSWLEAEVRNASVVLGGDTRTPLRPPIPSVHITSDGYAFPEYCYPLTTKPRIPIQEIKKKCPSCQASLSYYQKATKGGIKAFECTKCKTRLYSVEVNGEFSLRKRDPIPEEFACPHCAVTVTVKMDPVPGGSQTLECPSCKRQLRLTRGTSTIRVRLMRPISPANDDKFLTSVAVAMGPQPWPKGQLKKVAGQLGVTQRSVSKAVQHLIRAGKFKFQVRGKLHSPEP